VLPIDHTELLKAVNHEDDGRVQSLLDEIPCDACGEKTLVLTKETVERTAIFPGSSSCTIFVPIAECGTCGSRRRVLSADLLPGKQYSIPLIQRYEEEYFRRPSYRSAVQVEIGSWKPHFTTLHGWLGGMGERVLDQTTLGRDRPTPCAKPSLAPFTALVEETDRMTAGSTGKAFSTAVRVPAMRFRSERRREHLEAFHRLLALTAVIPIAATDGTPNSFTSLERLGLLRFRMPMLLFRSRIRGTPIQHVPAPPPRYTRSPGEGGSGHGPKKHRPLAVRADRGVARRRAHGPRAARPPPEDRP